MYFARAIWIGHRPDEPEFGPLERRDCFVPGICKLGILRPYSIDIRKADPGMPRRIAHIHTL